MKYVPKEDAEGINVSSGHPLADFAKLAVTIILFGGIFYGVCGFIADHLSSRLSPQQEAHYFGKNVENETPLQKLVDRLWSQYPESKTARISTTSVAMSEPNAFMSLGGNLSVTTELESIVKSENELAFVLCHEIGHFYLRHIARGVGRSLLVSFAFSFINVGGLSEGIMNTGIGMAELSFSREQESDADSFALDCMNRTYSHVNGFDGFFNRLKEDYESKQSATERKVWRYLSTHPDTGDRLKRMKKVIAETPYSTDGLTTAFEK